MAPAVHIAAHYTPHELNWKRAVLTPQRHMHRAEFGTKLAAAPSQRLSICPRRSVFEAADQPVGLFGPRPCYCASATSSLALSALARAVCQGPFSWCPVSCVER